MDPALGSGSHRRTTIHAEPENCTQLSRDSASLYNQLPAKVLVGVSAGQIRATRLCPHAKAAEKTQIGRQPLTPHKTKEPNSSTRKRLKCQAAERK